MEQLIINFSLSHSSVVTTLLNNANYYVPLLGWSVVSIAFSLLFTYNFPLSQWFNDHLVWKDPPDPNDVQTVWEVTLGWFGGVLFLRRLCSAQ